MCTHSPGHWITRKKQLQTNRLSWLPQGWVLLLMMTSSNGNIFRVTGSLCQEFTGHRWIPLTKASDAELFLCFLWSAPEQTIEQTIETPVIRHHCAHYDVTVVTWTQWLQLSKYRKIYQEIFWTLQWRHNEPDGVSIHQPHDCSLNHLLRHRSKKTSKLRVTGLCEENSPVTSEFPAQRASNVENVSIWWRHHGNVEFLSSDRWNHHHHRYYYYYHYHYYHYVDHSEKNSVKF